MKTINNNSVKRLQKVFANYRVNSMMVIDIYKVKSEDDLKDFYKEHADDISSYEAMDPIVAGQFTVTNYLYRWKLEYAGESLSELRKMALSTVEDDSDVAVPITSVYRVDPDMLIHCIYGTSKTRAEEWGAHGLGFVWTEKLFPNGSKIGLQVNCPDLESTRSDYGRLSYYARSQSEKSLTEVPVIVEFDIPAKYIFCENNKGEFQVDQENWMECSNLKITEIK